MSSRFGVVAGGNSYATPRYDKFGPWTEVEVGVLKAVNDEPGDWASEVVPAMKDYLEQGHNALYIYVPLKVVAKAIDSYGGIARYEDRSR
jgi:hypothetical protein